MTSPDTTRVSEAVARPVRGTVQGGLGLLLTDLIVEFGGVELTERQYGLAVLVLGVLASALQNLAENRGWIAPFLRQVPPRKVPLTDDDTGAVNLLGLAVVAVVVVLVLLVLT